MLNVCDVIIRRMMSGRIMINRYGIICFCVVWFVYGCCVIVICLKGCYDEMYGLFVVLC